MKETLSRSLIWLDARLAPLARHLPEALKAPLRRLARGAPAPVHAIDAAAADADATVDQAASAPVEPAPDERSPAEPAAAETGAAPPTDEYAERLRREQEIFADQIDINALPRIFHYWSHTYLRPKLEEFGCANPDEFFADALQAAAREAGVSPARFVSLGAGNCDTEVRVAQILVARGFTDFTLECVDINPVMLERGAALARESGLAAQVLPIAGDFNDWRPARRYDAVMANQSLHHVMNLEGLFDAIAANLPPHGRFVISDMIGRNGHLRWPEALAPVREFWAELPARYRHHRQLGQQWDEFVDFDCSGEGFEGIRAQDILPLLIERFGFERFLGFANVIDPFIDRGFGGHFDADSAHDLALIDRIHACDEAGMLDGRWKPTHAMAVMRKAAYAGPTQVWRHLTPAHCLRVPS
ncbi:MAG TPA: class I SAM-dependent methyltransferase [Tahibacter sp.]|uniref:class I SAM-dependent methyltransferase n=1 Tax=Tahibacter sp. TaxID=2056211 RepID=UPI002CF24D8B|nr:class I SAM-dependent methyltransferase [Tahibacter sp.]HSX58562.1 class I SAM-dependent methyltransferase [Tahibacter sp.]